MNLIYFKICAVLLLVLQTEHHDDFISDVHMNGSTLWDPQFLQDQKNGSLKFKMGKSTWFELLFFEDSLFVFV